MVLGDVINERLIGKTIHRYVIGTSADDDRDYIIRDVVFSGDVAMLSCRTDGGHKTKWNFVIPKEMLYKLIYDGWYKLLKIRPAPSMHRKDTIDLLYNNELYSIELVYIK